MDGLYLRPKARGLYNDVVARFKNAPSDSTRIASKIVVFITVRPYNPLHGKPRGHVILVGSNVDRFQVVQKRGTLIPRHVFRFIYDVITFKGADRDKGYVYDVTQSRSELSELLFDFLETLLAPINQIHLVHRNDHMLNSKQICDKRMTAGLLDDAFPRIYEYDRQIRRRCRSPYFECTEYAPEYLL